MPLDAVASVALDPSEGQQTGTIKWADARSFASFREIAAAEARAVRRALAGVGLCQFSSSVAEKGEDGARLHVALSGQAVAEAFVAEGLDPWRYGFLCADPIFARMSDDHGFHQEPVIDPTTGKQAVRLGLRHDQFMLLALAVLFAGERNELLQAGQGTADGDGAVQPGAHGGNRSGDGGAGSAVLNEELDAALVDDPDDLFPDAPAPYVPDFTIIPDELAKYAEADESAEDFRKRAFALLFRFGINDGEHFEGALPLTPEERIKLVPMLVANFKAGNWLKLTEELNPQA